MNGAHVAQESTKYLVNCIRFVGLTLCVVGPLINKVGQALFKYFGIQARFKEIFRVFAANPFISLFHPSLEQIYAPRRGALCRLRDEGSRHRVELQFA